MVAKQSLDSEDDFLKMQQEAIRRVREMQNRARATLEDAGMHIENHGDFPDGQANSARAKQGRPSEASFGAARSDSQRSDDTRSNGSRSEFSHESQKTEDYHTPPQRYTEVRGTAKQDEQNYIHAPGLNIALDKDQMLLLLMIYLLITDSADKWLILSLAYVLLT